LKFGGWKNNKRVGEL